MSRLVLWLSVLLSCVAGSMTAAEFSDSFANRQTAEGELIVLEGDNSAATREPGEPWHAGKPGGHSLWISWVAPSNGLLSLSTDGSSFDTLVSVYRLKPGRDNPLKRLEAIGDDDDDGLQTSASLKVGVREGQRYEIAVDGFAGAVGHIKLEMWLTSMDTLIPNLIHYSGDRSVQLGSTVILSVSIEETPGVELHWFHNGVKILDAEEPTLVLKNFSRSDVGIYQLNIEVGEVYFASSGLELQINSEGASSALARNKFQEAPGSGIVPPPGPGLAEPGRQRVGLADVGIGISRGYNGSQIFNTASATHDPNEPLHCGVAGGASYWFAYDAPADGVVSLDSVGSNFDTVLAVYSYTDPLTGYGDLVSVACDNDSGPDGRTSQLQFTATAGTHYLMVLDGVNGARGIAHLNYSLDVGAHFPVPPSLVAGPSSLVASAGNSVVLEADTLGDAPLSYQWYKNAKPIPSSTAPTLALLSLQPSDEGDYTVRVSNNVGTVLSEPARVQVRSTPKVALASGALELSFPAVRGYVYLLERSSLMTTNLWEPFSTAVPDPGGMIWLTNSPTDFSAQFYRLRKP